MLTLPFSSLQYLLQTVFCLFCLLPVPSSLRSCPQSILFAQQEPSNHTRPPPLPPPLHPPRDPLHPQPATPQLLCLDRPTEVATSIMCCALSLSLPSCRTAPHWPVGRAELLSVSQWFCCGPSQRRVARVPCNLLTVFFLSASHTGLLTARELNRSASGILPPSSSSAVEMEPTARNASLSVEHSGSFLRLARYARTHSHTESRTASHRIYRHVEQHPDRLTDTRPFFVLAACMAKVDSLSLSIVVVACVPPAARPGQASRHSNRAGQSAR